MENDQATFDKYHKYTTKSSPMAKPCIDDCKKNTICNIRAGKSEQRCDYESDVFNGEGIRKKSFKPKAHNCALNLESIRSRKRNQMTGF